MTHLARNHRLSKIDKPNLLLVEGPDDQLLLEKLVAKNGSSVAQGIQVVAVEGKDRFREEIRAVVGAQRLGRIQLRSLGVIRDADEDADASFRSVRDGLKNADTALSLPSVSGEVVGLSPRVGVFIMLDGTSPGSLESLCLRSVHHQPAAKCVEQYLVCLDTGHGWDRDRQPLAAQRDKAFAHAYLASRKDPVARIGEGARQGVWDFNHEVFQPVVRFLVKLVGEAN